MAEKRIRKQSDRLKNRVDPGLLLRAAEQSPSVIVITDPEGRIIYANNKFTEMSGYSQDEALGTISQILAKDGHEQYQEMWQLLINGEQWQGEFHYQKKNGEYYWERATVSPILDSQGQITHFIAIKEDITDRKQIEDDLERTVAEATQLAANMEYLNAELKATQSQMLQSEKMASIGQLAAGVAHEINNPIGFVSSNLRTLNKYVDKLADYIALLEGRIKEDSPNSWNELKPQRKKLKIDFVLEDSEDLLTESLDGSERVRKIVQNLKTFSRVDRAEEHLADINECLESTINMVWNEIKYKAKLEKDYADLPDLLCNPQQLAQVFTNILVNAAQAIEEQGIIKVMTRVVDEQIVVSISDTGVGIPEDIRARIFEPFFTTKDVGKGTGLGMSISYEIIKRHHGEIFVDSEVGVGSTFRVCLPLQPGDDETALPPETEFGQQV